MSIIEFFTIENFYYVLAFICGILAGYASGYAKGAKNEQAQPLLQKRVTCPILKQGGERNYVVEFCFKTHLGIINCDCDYYRKGAKCAKNNDKKCHCHFCF